MSKIPFEKFILALLFLNKSVPYIVEKLKTFHYHISEPEVSEIFDDLKSILPETIRNHVIAGNPLSLKGDTHVQWLKQMSVFEVYDYMVKGAARPENPPEYFKWMEDILWAHTYEDVMTLINILLFNGEDKASISKIVNFKYRRKIAVDALILYEMTFWDTKVMTSKEAMYHCIPFRTNTLIIRKMRAGGTEIGMFDDAANPGSNVDFLFHDNNYIKWKIGYKDIEVPGTHDFFESVKKDSYFKYYESMNMTQSVETFDEEGTNDKIGAYESHKVSRKNVEEQKAKLAKAWIDLYLKANEAAPEGAEKEKFFDELNQVSLDFHDDEKIIDVDQAKEILEDIKGDM